MKKDDINSTTFVGPYNFSMTKDSNGKWVIKENKKYYFQNTNEENINTPFPPTKFWDVAKHGSSTIPEIIDYFDILCRINDIPKIEEYLKNGYTMNKSNYHKSDNPIDYAIRNNSNDLINILTSNNLEISFHNLCV